MNEKKLAPEQQDKVDLQLRIFDLAAPTQAIQVAAILQKFVKENNLTANIKGKQYPLVESWQFAGSQLGLYPILISCKDLSSEKEVKYQAEVEVRRLSDNVTVSRGIALCSNREGSKRGFDEYAILSMAQTRAEGKAFRMLLAWLMKAAGFEATPAEEMDFKHQPEKNGFDEEDFLQSWGEEIKKCKTSGDLMNLYRGNSETVDKDTRIKAMFKLQQAAVK